MLVLLCPAIKQNRFMRVKVKPLADEWEYPEAHEDVREKLPNRKFKMNQPENYSGEGKNAGRSKKKSRRKNKEYVQQRTKAGKARV